VSGRHVSRRRVFPWSALLVLIGSLLFGAVLNGRALLETASSLEPGWQRNVAISAANAAVVVGEMLHLDVLRAWMDQELGRQPAPDEPIVMPTPTMPTTVVVSTTTTSSVPPGTTTSVPTTPTTLPGVFVPTPESPVHVWIAGDSLTERFGPSLANLLAGTGVVESRRDVEYSTGLTRPDFFDWPRFLEAVLTDTRTDILVFMIGANDGQPILTDSGWIPFGTERWADEYRRRVAATMDLVAELAPTTYWVGQPIARSAEYSAKMALIDEIYRDEAAEHPNVRYVDSWALFSDADGAYSAYLPDAEGENVLMRISDGIHLTVDGGERLARWVGQFIADDWPLFDGPRP
jgi:hypothetical protein